MLETLRSRGGAASAQARGRPGEDGAGKRSVDEGHDAPGEHDCLAGGVDSWERPLMPFIMKLGFSVKSIK